MGFAIDFFLLKDGNLFLMLQFDSIIQMFKTKGPNGSSSREKRMPPKPRPDFSTDFVDREKYKLSETEMIQKKAALQSKHREEAIQDLQQRRRKLQQGIIDDDTRKVYETALTSKKIDINPSIRKNLSQMIRYEKEKQEQMRPSSREKQRSQHQWVSQQHNKEESEDDNDDIEKQLRDTRDFIKKFQRVKKMDNIGRAVEMLAEPQLEQTRKTGSKKFSRQKSKEKSLEKNPFCNQKLLVDLKESKTSAVSSQEQALSSIQDTIRFMEERLFSAKRIQQIKLGEMEKLRQSTISYDSKQPFVGMNQIQTKQNLELSGLGYHQSDTEEECLQTIRRMKQMMEGQDRPSPLKLKQNQEKQSNKSPRFQGFSTLQKVSPHIADSQAEVDFSLTLNSESEPSSLRQSKFPEAEDRQYERLKNSLFEEVNRLQLQTPQASIYDSQYQPKSSLPIDQSSISNLRSMPTPPPKKKKVNSEIAKLKNQIEGVRDNVESIKVEPMGISRPGEVMGVDFRGSINIKKHIIQK